MLALLFVTLTISLHGAELKGYISDAACGWNNARPGKEAKECAVKCVNAGWDPVFVADGGMKTYKLSDKSKAQNLVGERVAVKGELKGGEVKVLAIRKLPPQAR